MRLITSSQDSFWCGEMESNHRHEALQAPALPTELPPLLFSGRMMGFEPMTKGATILYSTNWATISIFVPSKESNLHTYNVFLYLLSRVIMIQYHQDEIYDLAASPIYALNRHVVGVAGFEPAQLKHLIYSQARLSSGGELPLFRMVSRTRTCDLCIPNAAFCQLNYYHIYSFLQTCQWP